MPCFLTIHRVTRTKPTITFSRFNANYKCISRYLINNILKNFVVHALCLFDKIIRFSEDIGNTDMLLHPIGD